MFTMRRSQVAWFLEGPIHMSTVRDLRRNGSELLRGPFTTDELAARLTELGVQEVYLPIPVQLSHLAKVANVRESAPPGYVPRADDVVIVGDNPTEGSRFYMTIIYEEYVPE